MPEPSLRDVLNAVNALGNRLAAVESQLVGVANRLTAVEERLSALENRVEQMHVSLASKLDAWELAGVVERTN